MVYEQLEITTPHIIYALLGAFTFFFGMFSLLLREKLYIGEAIWAFAFGVIIGPYGADIFDPRSWGHSSNPDEPINTIIIEFTRIVLTIGMFAIGIELPKAYVVKHWKSMFFLLVPVTTWSWFVCAGLIYAFIPGHNILSSLAVSACLTATDPILASAIVGGKWADKHVPTHIRHLLAAESGCNEGAALLFLFLALYLMVDLPDVGTAMKDWFLIIWLYEIALSIAIGSLLGLSFRHLMKFSQRHDLINRPSYVAQYLSLAILTVGVTTLLGTDDLLAAFICGTSFSWDGFFNKQTEKIVFSSVVDGLFNIAAFIFVGAWMPFGNFRINMNGDLGTGIEVWRLTVLAVLILLLRRLPIMMGLYRWIPELRSWKEAAFYGHFGPMGITAIFMSTLGNEFLRRHIDSHPSLPTGSNYQQIEFLRDTIEPIIAFVVLCSIIIHGLTIPGFTLGKRVHSLSRTWSRWDATGAPDWTNRATLVTKPEDIIINRDLEKGEINGVSLERTMTVTNMRSPSNANVKEDMLKEDTMTEKVNFPVPASITPSRQTAVDHDQHRHHQYPPDGEPHQSSEWRGDQRVPEKASDGSEDDTEITVINVSPNHRTSTNGNVNATSLWTSRRLHASESGTEEIGHSMRDGIGRNVRGRGTTASGNGAMEIQNRTRKGKRPDTADTLVNDEGVDDEVIIRSQEDGVGTVEQEDRV